MSLFGKQLQDRIRTDQQTEDLNLKKLGDAVSGKKRLHYRETSSSLENIRQIGLICRYLGLPVPEKTRPCDSLDEQISMMLQPSGATRRVVELTDKWWRNGDGPLLAQIEETGETLALIPGRFGGYHYTDPQSGEKVWVTEKNKDRFAVNAYCFYKPLPDKPLSGHGYIRFLLRQLSGTDILILIYTSLHVVLLGLVTPLAINYAFQNVIPSGQQTLLISLGILMLSAALSTWLMSVAKTSIMSRIGSRLSVIGDNAVYARLMHLPSPFFSGQTAGGLASKVSALNSIPSLLISLFFDTFLTLGLSLIYVAMLFTIAEPLTMPVLVIYGVEILLFVITVIQEKKIVLEALSAGENNSGMVLALLSGIQKIKASGNEQRAFSKWMETYTAKTLPAHRILFPYSFRGPIITVIHMLGTLWLYIIAYRSNLTLAQFASFSSIFGMAMAGISALSRSGSTISMFEPILELGRPILETVPEETLGKRVVTSLTGEIRLDQVVFRYAPDSPAVLDNLSLHIRPGEYVAIVGKSGCGKSTLMKILLGFEEPEQGSVYYDGYDLGSLDRHSLRRHIGTVLQDGQLFAGDILSNITITAPWMGEEGAWEAAEKAGVAEDIRRMPMRMRTMISEGGGGISGGQKQRIMIARALCPKPNVIMMDEATSALDNLTQKIVTDSLDAMKCTRLIIAHRLSTIQHCDRIIVLDQGKIAEDGTYDELLARNGIFTELARRQMVEEEEI